jgi:hypothetical protein
MADSASVPITREKLAIRQSSYRNHSYEKPDQMSQVEVQVARTVGAARQSPAAGSRAFARSRRVRWKLMIFEVTTRNPLQPNNISKSTLFNLK